MFRAVLTSNLVLVMLASAPGGSLRAEVSPVPAAAPTDSVFAVGPRTDHEDRPLRPHLMLLGGVSGLGGNARHPFGGAEIGGFWGRFGVVGIGQYGDGNGFRSILLGGGPAVEIADVGFASFSAYAGIARYEEEQEVGFTRSVTGPYAAMTARIPLRVGAIGVTLSLWRGTLDGEGFESPETVTGRRLSIGFGW